MCSLFNLHTNAKLRTLVLPRNKYLKVIYIYIEGYSESTIEGYSESTEPIDAVNSLPSSEIRTHDLDNTA